MSKIKLSWVYYVLLGLICLTMMSTHLVSGLFARYCAEASGSDSARVAQFGASTNFVSSSTIVDSFAQSEAEYVFTVTGQSETAAQCVIAVTVKENDVATPLPQELTMTLQQDGTTVNWDSAKCSSGKYVSNPIDYPLGGNTEKSFTLVITGDSQQIVQTKRLKLAIDAEMTQVN